MGRSDIHELLKVIVPTPTQTSVIETGFPETSRPSGLSGYPSSLQNPSGQAIAALKNIAVSNITCGELISKYLKNKDVV